MKKLLCMALAVVLCFGALCGCGNDSGNSDASNTETDSNAVAMKIDGRDITADEYKYFIMQAAIMELSSRKPDFEGDFTAVDWNEKLDGEKTLLELIKERAIDEIKSNVIIASLGEENGVSLTADEKKQAETMTEQIKEQQGEETLKLALRQMGLSSVDSFKKVYELTSLYSKVADDMGANRDKYITDELEEKLKEYKSNDRVTAQHVLIMNESEKHENPKEVIDEVQKRAAAGEDFNALMTEFNEDPGQGAGGYTFGKGEMVPEFEQAAFALDYNGISEVVQSSYGYHVLKRIVGAEELKAYLAENADIELNDDVLNNISVEALMNDVKTATDKLNEIMGGSNNG